MAQIAIVVQLKVKHNGNTLLIGKRSKDAKSINIPLLSKTDSIKYKINTCGMNSTKIYKISNKDGTSMYIIFEY